MRYLLYFFNFLNYTFLSFQFLFNTSLKIKPCLILFVQSLKRKLSDAESTISSAKRSRSDSVMQSVNRPAAASEDRPAVVVANEDRPVPASTQASNPVIPEEVDPLEKFVLRAAVILNISLDDAKVIYEFALWKGDKKGAESASAFPEKFASLMKRMESGGKGKPFSPLEKLLFLACLKIANTKKGAILLYMARNTMRRTIYSEWAHLIVRSKGELGDHFPNINP